MMPIGRATRVKKLDPESLTTLVYDILDLLNEVERRVNALTARVDELEKGSASDDVRFSDEPTV